MSLISAGSSIGVKDLSYYIVGNPEWDNGTRSDVVLETKSSVLDLPPIIIEIQPTVNSLFIKRAINYSLESFNRHKLDPIVLIICTDTLSSDSVAKDVKTSDIPACYDFPSTGWACNCLIVCERRVPEYTDTMPLNPFIALISFLTSRKLTINCSFYPDDPTIQHLYTLASHLHQNRPGDQHITDILAQANCFSKNEVFEIDGVSLFGVLHCSNQSCNSLWQRDMDASRNVHFISGIQSSTAKLHSCFVKMMSHNKNLAFLIKNRPAPIAPETILKMLKLMVLLCSVCYSAQIRHVIHYGKET